MELIKSIQAEWLKSKKSIIIWLLIFGSLTINIVVMLIYFFAEESIVTLYDNPWKSYIGRNLKSFTLFFWVPFLIILTSAYINIEHKANNWKSLFALPVLPRTILTSKLVLLIIFVMSILLTYMITLFLFPLIINLVHPEYEFYLSSVNYSEVFVVFIKLFFLSLGIISIQFILSLYFKNQIISIGVGFVFFIIGFIANIQNIGFSNYYPYSFPSFVDAEFNSIHYAISILIFIISLLILTLKKNLILVND